MIYPRLKFKSEVFATVLDGKKGDHFRIENEFEKTNEKLNKAK